MLAANVAETPRPRPPAKIRRSTALAASTPPPSYATAFALTPENKPRLDTLLGSPIPATFQRVGWDSGANSREASPGAEEDVEWMHERSREELSDLLVKADGLIKERENELEMASTIVKALHDNNVMLKTKHQQLLARLPSNQKSPSPSPDIISRTPSRYNVSLSRPISEFDSSPVTSTYKGHTRKISVSPAEISLLADQNAELLEKLERMESESLSADRTGRRALKRLEKEIKTLREELEETQAKSEELEQKTKAGFGWDSEKVVTEVLRKKEEREAKFKAMRNLGQDRRYDEDETSSEIRDFAPESSIPGMRSSSLSTGDTPRRFPSTPARPIYAPAPLTPHPESNLIAQLLEKIQELEETNNHILDQQSETKNQLNAMQRETDHISKVYEYFSDANITEVPINSISGSEPSHDETIRFKSFRRNLEGDFSSTPGSSDIRQSLNISTVVRSRKSVVGLFDGPEDGARGGSTPDHLKSFNLPIPFASPAREHVGHRKSQSVGSNGLASPALSSLSLYPSRMTSQNPFNSPQTLEKELCGAFNDRWGPNASRNHLRTNSLYDLSSLSAPPSPSPSSQASLDRSRNIGSPYEPRDAPPTPMPLENTALHLSIEPPTPDKVLAAGKNQAETSEKQHSLRYYRMTETVRSRTNRWVDGRFKDTLTGKVTVDTPPGADVDDQEDSRPPTPLPLRLASAFEEAIDTITMSARPHAQGQEVVKASDSKSEKNARGFGTIMLELWLWLQFAVIILVFLWAMAKRGPRSVISETAHRRTVSSSH
ncbi:hypothetical protein DXG03_000153 [Asterophora parasitica]|uniref:Uncharacterized protein n=1 Tax=Asterophora parasitica TaxID=117018 RepID=A0A9P7GE08_9AGAR|nr:hypothetical protein DXG03_000153 [Asterophora parasitica]